MSDKDLFVLVGSCRNDYPRDETWMRWFRSGGCDIIDLTTPVDYKSRWTRGGIVPWLRNVLVRHFSWAARLRQMWRWFRNPDVSGVFVFRNNYLLLPFLWVFRRLSRHKPLIVYDAWISISLKAETTGQHPWVVKAIGRLERWLLSRADLLIAASNGYRTYYEQKGLRKVRVIPLTAGAKWEAFPRVKDEAKSSFVYWGNFLEQHGVDVLIEAAEKMALDRFQVHLCGEGKSRGTNQVRTRKSGRVSRHMEFLGYVADEELIPMVDSCLACFGHLRAIHDFDLVLPNKAIQALSRGKPVIMVRADGFQIVVGQRSPVFFFDGSPEDLAKKMDGFLQKGGAAKREEQAAMEFYEKNHSWAVVKAAADEVFKEFLEKTEPD